MIKETIFKQISIYNSIRNSNISYLFCGAGLYHAIYNEDSLIQIPLTILFPSAYVGYHSFKYYCKNHL